VDPDRSPMGLYRLQLLSVNIVTEPCCLVFADILEKSGAVFASSHDIKCSWSLIVLFVLPSECSRFRSDVSIVYSYYMPDVDESVQ